MLCTQSEVEIETLFSRIESGDLNLQPDFQRGEVWKENKKQKLIDSILRGWKIPPIHVVQNQEFVDEVLDGQQRLVSIRDFKKDLFPIDGNIVPFSPAIQKLDGLKFSELDKSIQRQFNKYAINLIRLTEFSPQEPAELFFRLNQPTSLTSAEQRNAFMGKPRDQVKSLTRFFEEKGAAKETIGFSNSRMSYDEIISKLCYAIENKNISRKITSTLMSEQYRDDIPFSDNTIEIVKKCLNKFINSIEINKGPRIVFSKAGIFSWLLFTKEKESFSDEKLSNIITLFEFSRLYVKDVKTILNWEYLIENFKTIKNKYDFIDFMLSTYNQRASMGSTDGSSIVQRDLIINLFTEIYLESIENANNSNLLDAFLKKYEKTKNFNNALETIIDETKWGERF